jgi:hypothetical protein
MAFINTLKELLEYKKRIELQNDVLPLATLFPNEEKQELSECYEMQLAIINHKLFAIQNSPNNQK